MAAGRLQPPGSEYGPCIEECQHSDCAQTRSMAQMLCQRCGEPIGYDTPFYQDGSWTTLEHQLCALKALER